MINELLKLDSLKLVSVIINVFLILYNYSLGKFGVLELDSTYLPFSIIKLDKARELYE